VSLLRTLLRECRVGFSVQIAPLTGPAIEPCMGCGVPRRALSRSLHSHASLEEGGEPWPLVELR
jgi:hypothetical protein